jgi:orotidine-5'-phosphate decarboxylase
MTSATRSAKSIPSKERLILALDVPDVSNAMRLVEELGDSVAFYKVFRHPQYRGFGCSPASLAAWHVRDRSRQ